MAEISVIVPVYNVEKYLNKCVDSIINQTFKDIEIILVDDGSTDSSPKICDDYTKVDSRIKVVHQKNSGLSAARNTGIRQSSGKYLAFIDSDDYISKDFCEILYNSITKEKADVSCINLETVREDGYVIVTTNDKDKLQSNYKKYVYNKKQILKEILLRKKIDSRVCTKLYKRELFNNCMFKEGTSYEDILFMYELSKSLNKVVYVNKICYSYLKRRNSITATSSVKNLNDFLDIILYRYEDIAKRKAVDEKYNVFAIFESIISVSIKYIIANDRSDIIEKKSKKVFDIIKEYFKDNIQNQKEILPYLNESTKICLFLILYNTELFYNFLKKRQDLRTEGRFVENIRIKPKICLLCDVEGWAFDSIAKKIQKDLSHKYNIVIDYFNMYEEPDNFYECIERNLDCDLIHVFWRKSLLLFESDAFKEKLSKAHKDYNNYIEEVSRKISTCVYDFIYLEPENIEIYKNVFNKYAQSYYVANKRLYDVYNKIDSYRKPYGTIYDFCDWKHFTPMNLERFEFKNIKKREIVIGWVGNGDRKFNGADLKGLHTIIEPVIEELRKEGYKIKADFADRNVVWRSSEEMPEYYSNIDICLCTSIHEGTPRPVLEAMCSGIPVISTNVGIVPEIFGKYQSQFNIGDRTENNSIEIKEKLKEKIIFLYNNRDMFKKLSKENIDKIKKYDGGKIIKEFDKYFENCMNK